MSRNTKYLHEELDKPNEHDKQIARQARQEALREAAEIARKFSVGWDKFHRERIAGDEIAEDIAVAIEKLAKETE